MKFTEFLSPSIKKRIKFFVFKIVFIHLHLEFEEKFELIATS